MQQNHNYNLMKQYVQEHKSLWRIKHSYKKDSGSCKECKALWSALEKDKEGQVKKLHGMIKKHLK